MLSLNISYAEKLSTDLKASLHYISGYCLQSPAKLRQVCMSCMLPLVDSAVEEHSLLVTLKDYKDGVKIE